MKEPRDTFSIGLAETEKARQLLRGMVQDLSDRFPTLKRQDVTSTQSQSDAPPATSNTQTAVPLNAANLQQQQQQLSKMHQRSASRSAQTPAAPTSSAPPFPFGGGSSPHGTPAYIGKTQITQENLHLPARKKARPNNAPATAQGTPGSNASPQVKPPELKRQDSKPLHKPPLCCSEPDCERHNVGFDSKEALDLHTQEEHIRPLQDPFKYAQENLASVLGVDSNGRSKQMANNQTPTAGVKMVANNSRQDQTPRTPASTTTPMNRQNSMNRQASATGTKSNVEVREPLTKTQIDQKGSEKIHQLTKAAVVMDPWEGATIDPTELSHTFRGFDTDVTAAISDSNAYRSITPNDTPESSKDGVSEPNSDISEGVGLDINLDLAFDDNWQPFGVGDMDGLADMSNFHLGDEDMTMLNGDHQPSMNVHSWDDMIDFDKPFMFDTTMYSMGE